MMGTKTGKATVAKVLVNRKSIVMWDAGDGTFYAGQVNAVCQRPGPSLADAPEISLQVYEVSEGQVWDVRLDEVVGILPIAVYEQLTGISLSDEPKAEQADEGEWDTFPEALRTLAKEVEDGGQDAYLLVKANKANMRTPIQFIGHNTDTFGVIGLAEALSHSIKERHAHGD